MWWLLTKENSITTQPEVDISAYTENIYASHQSFIFIGWVTGEGAGVIRDYTDVSELTPLTGDDVNLELWWALLCKYGF